MLTKPNPYLALTGGIVVIGFAAILIRQAEAPGTITSFYRLAIGTGVVTLPFLHHLRKRATPLSAKGIQLAIAGGFFFAMDQALWATGVVASGAAIPTILVNTAPLWVGLGALVLFRERQSLLFWIGVLLAVVGGIFILKADIGSSSQVVRGGLLGATAAVFYAGFHLISQKGRDRLNTLEYFWIMSLSATGTLLAINLFLGHPFTGYAPATYLNFVLLGILVQVIGWLLINYCQGYLPATIVAPSLLLQPIITVIFAWLLLSERLTLWQIVGGGVVLLGILIVHRSRRK